MNFSGLRNIMTSIHISDLLDILIVAFILYRILLLIQETRAIQLVKGIVVILIFAKVSEWLNLYTINWLLGKAITLGFFILVIVFQPELRRILERLGRTNNVFKNLIDLRGENKDHNSDEIVSAVGSLARQKIGALIVIQGETGLSDIIDSGVKLEAIVSSELLINIFIPNTPLHDGAVIINGETIRAAGCFLPLTENKSISKQLGTRHRAALGISENSDALVIIVSEETGTISLAQDGRLERYVDIDTLREKLYNFFFVEKNTIFIKKQGDKDEEEID